MRRLATLLALMLLSLIASAASAQSVTGVVDTIGFDGKYRPGCWTPMLVRLQAGAAPTGLYELRVWQHDLDGDLPYYSTRVTLTQSAGEQRFWTYFIPEPIRGGLTSPMSTSSELQQRLRITVHDAKGRELAQLATGAGAPRSVDPVLGPSDRGRGSRFVVFVRDGGSAPPLKDYGNDPRGIVGLQEGLEYVPVTPDKLPESVLGYDGIDALVWLEGDPAQLRVGDSRRLEAIRQYVQRGGHLVINTPAIREQIEGFEDLLPVDITEMSKGFGQGPAGELAGSMPFPPKTDPSAPAGGNPWDRFRADFSLAIAKPRPGAVVDQYAFAGGTDGKPETQTPWLVRRPFGFGCVSWVAQDLGARELARNVDWGWPRVWERVLGTASLPTVLPQMRDKQQYAANTYRDLGATVLDAMNLKNEAAALVGVTILFFVGYWLLAGPGTFFYLRYRRRATASWFIFGAVALGATAVTLGIVRLVLRGPPSVAHVSLVRVNADRNQPAMAISRLGVYVKRDGAQTIALTDTDKRQPSTIEPFPIHASLHAGREGDRFLFPAPIEYRVPVPTGDDPPAPSVDVPFRTTMKRVRADWFGLRDERIEGSAQLRPTGLGGTIAGLLKNQTGVALRNVYVAFRHRTPGGNVPIDYMIHVPGWAAGDVLDLNVAFNPPGPDVTLAKVQIGMKDVGINERFPTRGTLPDWADYFGQSLGPGSQFTGTLHSDLDNRFPVSVPVLSLFGRYPPIANKPDGGGGFSNNRAELHRSGLRDWDATNALLGGALVIIAEATNVPVPTPMTIEGDKVTGSGITIYQFVLPLTPIAPTTQPSTTRAVGMQKAE